MKLFIKILFFFVFILFFNKELLSEDFDTAKKYLNNKEYDEAYKNLIHALMNVFQELIVIKNILCAC